MFRREGGDDFLDVGGDDVALAEVFDVENFAQDALGEEVLDEYFLDSGLGEVRVQRAAAGDDEFLERGLVFRVLLARLFQDGAGWILKVSELNPVNSRAPLAGRAARAYFGGPPTAAGVAGAGRLELPITRGDC